MSSLSVSSRSDFAGAGPRERRGARRTGERGAGVEHLQDGLANSIEEFAPESPINVSAGASDVEHGRHAPNRHGVGRAQGARDGVEVGRELEAEKGRQRFSRRERARGTRLEAARPRCVFDAAACEVVQVGRAMALEEFAGDLKIRYTVIFRRKHGGGHTFSRMLKIFFHKSRRKHSGAFKWNLELPANCHN